MYRSIIMMDPPEHDRFRALVSRVFIQPDVFNIDRTPTLALGLGYGIHSCLGAALARMESRIAVEELAKRWPAYEVDEAGLARVQMSNVAGYSNVPVHRAR
jgi:cytochrome P450